MKQPQLPPPTPKPPLPPPPPSADGGSQQRESIPGSITGVEVVESDTMEKGECSKKGGCAGDQTQEQGPPSLELQPLLQQVAAGASFDWTPIFDRVTHSLFFVLLQPKREHLKDIFAVSKRVKTVRSGERWTRAKSSYTSTGFVYANGPLGPIIQTCAHGLEHVYKASDPLTISTADMFNVRVLCDHQEHDFQQAGAVGRRKYANARIVGHDCARDILLIGLTDSELKNFFDDGVCSKGHPALVIAKSIPREARPCMLISWPSHKPRTVAVGWSSSPRALNAICWPNLEQYDMTLLEVNMTTEKGSSGAPLIDTNGEVIGILHGGFGGAHSYFVAAHHLRIWR
uniref:Uncharacterized protein n=1 Tax=Avena sativa TaxID=4498 RepID=A0ACD5W7L9_AVESA